MLNQSRIAVIRIDSPVDDQCPKHLTLHLFLHICVHLRPPADKQKDQPEFPPLLSNTRKLGVRSFLNN